MIHYVTCTIFTMSSWATWAVSVWESVDPVFSSLVSHYEPNYRTAGTGSQCDVTRDRNRQFTALHALTHTPSELSFIHTSYRSYETNLGVEPKGWCNQIALEPAAHWTTQSDGGGQSDSLWSLGCNCSIVQVQCSLLQVYRTSACHCFWICRELAENHRLNHIHRLGQCSVLEMRKLSLIGWLRVKMLTLWFMRLFFYSKFFEGASPWEWGRRPFYQVGNGGRCVSGSV